VKVCTLCGGQFVTEKTVNKHSYSDVSHVKVGKWLTATG
jgi:hypothetical protein